jgi:energy-coupling factor transporter ATP-binding protein EcfA2
MVQQAVGTMSGGEKARLVLAMIVWQRPNLLLLDEPTNHLDLATREALSMALNEFEGTVMLVSHDRALLRAVCDEFWLVGRGGIAPFDGDLDDYQRYLLDEAKRVREAVRAANANAAPPAAPAPPPRPRRRRRRRSSASSTPPRASNWRPPQAAEEGAGGGRARMAQRQAEKQALEAQLAAPLPAAEMADAGRRLKSAPTRWKPEERWLALSGEIEALESADAGHGALAAEQLGAVGPRRREAAGSPQLHRAPARRQHRPMPSSSPPAIPPCSWNACVRKLLNRRALVGAAASAVPLPGVDWPSTPRCWPTCSPEINARSASRRTSWSACPPTSARRCRRRCRWSARWSSASW